jgi:hypothetical protein
VRLDGEHRIFERDCPEGRKLANRFCPACGTTVCWTLDLRPEHYGVAAGAFTDAAFAPPTYSVWERSMAAWVTLPDGLAHFREARVVT